MSNLLIQAQGIWTVVEKELHEKDKQWIAGGGDLLSVRNSMQELKQLATRFRIVSVVTPTCFPIVLCV
jgi:hypothetical protein